MLNNNKKQETQFFGTKCGNANSIAAGYATETTNYGEIATGILNKSTKGDNPNSPEGVVGDPKATLFSVGCGTKRERKNALEVKGDGSVIISGKDGSDVNINKEIKYLKDRSIIIGDDDQILIPYLSANTVMLIRKVNVGDYMYAELKDGLEDDTVPQYIYDTTTGEIIKITENKFDAIEINSGDYFNTEGFLNLSHELYLDNEKTGNISDLEKLTIKESDVFEGLPYVCEDDTLEDGEAPQYIYDATDKKWIIVNESQYITSVDFFNTEKPLDLSHILRYNKDKNIFDYNRTAGSGAVVMGYKAQATGYGSIALGCIAEAKGDNSIALGTTASTRNTDSIAIGNFAQTEGEYCIALGSNTNACGNDSMALGVAAYAKEENSIAIGTMAVAKSSKSTVLGCEAEAPEYSSGSTIVGYKAQTGGDFSVAMGYNAQSLKADSVVIGTDARAANYYATVVGFDAHTTNICATAVGCKAQAAGELSIALGYNAQATHDYAIALGSVTKTKPYSKYTLGGYDKNKKVEYNIEEITFSQYGNKKYIIGLGGYDGTNLTTNEAGKEVLNPNIKSVQEIINSKADITPIVTSTDSTISLQPNKKYEITAGDTLVLMFTEPSDKTTKNEYLCSINIGASVPTITFPKEIIWDVEPVIAANKHYEINVQYSQGKYWGTIRAWEFPNDEVVLDETEQYVKPVLFAKNSNVTLKRALKTGQENSLCLPFAMTQEQISEIWGANTEIYYISGSDAKNIYFNTTTNIEAGFPCLIKPERINTNNVYNIHNVPASSWYSKDTVPEYIGENIRSVGLFSPSVVKAGSYVFSGGKLYHLTSDMNSKGFRIYFEDLV